jgi:hypothetical protein
MASLSSLWFGAGKLKVDGNLDPSFHWLAAGPRRHEAPFLDRFRRRVVEQVVARAGIDLDGFGPALFIDEYAQKHSAFFTFTPGALRVVRPRSFAIAGLS